MNSPWLVTHPLDNTDSASAAALRAAVAPIKGVFDGVAGRERFNSAVEALRAPPGVSFEAATIGGTSGWWARPAVSQKDAAIIYIHGGWFTWGAAKAFRNFAGHVASITEANVFVPDYRLAPEYPFPAAVRDLEACYRGLVDEGVLKIAIAGDSAGGNLALVLLSLASARASHSAVAPAGAVVFSPITDLALTGNSYDARAQADLYFTKAEAATLVKNYLGNGDPRDPLASPLYADLAGLPPIRIHVGDDEVLLDDSRRYVERAIAAGVDAKVDVWMGMPHDFALNIGVFSASTQALAKSGAFLAERLKGPTTNNVVGEELAKFEGTWRFVSGKVDELTVPKADLRDVSMVIRGDRATISLGKQTLEALQLRVNPAARPKQIDATTLDGSEQGSISLGIYELDRDSLRICQTWKPRTRRPEKFEIDEGSGLVLNLWKRGL